jgi:hypothetical protein
MQYPAGPCMVILHSARIRLKTTRLKLSSNLLLLHLYSKKPVYSVKDATMAKWVGEGTPPITGTVDCLTIYQLPDKKWYVRMRSSITAKRIKKDPVFKGFRNSSFRMKDASPIASRVYKLLAVKKYPLFREMTGKALLLLKMGIHPEQITAQLMAEYIPVKTAPKLKRKPFTNKLKKIPRPLLRRRKLTAPLLRSYALFTPT